MPVTRNPYCWKYETISLPDKLLSRCLDPFVLLDSILKLLQIRQALPKLRRDNGILRKLFKKGIPMTERRATTRVSHPAKRHGGSSSQYVISRRLSLYRTVYYFSSYASTRSTTLGG